MAVSAAIGYGFAKYPELPGMISRSVRKIRKKLEDAKDNGEVPDELQAQYRAAHELFVAFDEAMEDSKLNYSEVRRIGIAAYQAGRSLLALLKQ